MFIEKGFPLRKSFYSAWYSGRMNPSSEIITDSLEAVQSVFRSFRATILERAGNTEYISKQGAIHHLAC
jgi:hypothetical protein